MADPTPVPSSQGGSPTLPTDLYKLLKSVANRVAILERTSTLSSASIGSGGISVYDAGAFRWYNYNYNNQLPKEDNVGALVFEIGAFDESDTEDFDAAFRYYFANKEARAGLPVVVVGAFPQVDDSSHDSHGIAVYALGNDTDREVLAASDDGILLQKSKDQEPDGGPQTLLRALKDDDDILRLFLSNEQSYFKVMTDGTNQRAMIKGGNSGTGYGALMLMKGTSGGDDRSVHFQNSDNTANYVDVHADNFVNEPSSEAFKTMLGVKEDDFIASIMAAPVQRWTRKVPDEIVDADGNPLPEEEHVFTEKFSPTVETMPQDCVVDSGAEETTGLSLNASLWTLWGACQQQQLLIEDKDKRIADLEKNVEALTKSVAALLAK